MTEKIQKPKIFQTTSQERPNMTPLSRRTLLRGAGVSLAVPLLDAMHKRSAFGDARSEPPRRMIAIETNQGILPHYFFPGPEGGSSPYLDLLNDYRSQMTFFSGVSHPEVDGGHQAEICFLTAAPHPGRSGFRNTISLDQFAAERIGHRTRYPSLTLGVLTNGSISFTGAGVQIPGIDKPSEVFQKLFVQGSPKEVEAQVARLRQGRSILDSVADRAKALQRQVGPADRSKLEQYFTGVRELEQRLHKSEQWEQKPKPTVDMEPPEDHNDPGALLENTAAMYSLAKLAIETDSTRLVTVYIHQNAAKPNIPGITEGTHPLTHHGNQPEKLAQLRKIEEAQFRELAKLLGSLSESGEQGGSLLDRTMVLYGTCMGNANSHDNTNLPVLLAGGGFKHAGHLAFDKDRNYPLPNLYVSMLQRLGIETDRFATSTGTMRGLEMGG